MNPEATIGEVSPELSKKPAVEAPARNHFVCIHGHFYQPPRENPWLETVQEQESATPFHNWNERITVECYAPNAASRVLDASGCIAEIVNNYSRMSFNFGPTLLRWLEHHSPSVYSAILEADQLSLQAFSGHGAAIAQAYHHPILPLANRRDKYTEIIWGIRDFQSRFKRKPEGMWLPETAVDLETLEILSELGIRFTILSPYQAKRIRKSDESQWTDVSGGRIDPKLPYLALLPSGRQITLFFYDGPIARAVAFEGLLNSGDQFAERLAGTFSKSGRPEMVHIATDGETFGHHHRHGEMALSYGLRHLEAARLAHVTVYGEYLERFPPEHYVEIIPNSSWSCAHGVDRWRRDCGCRVSSPPTWNQSWRAPLRDAMDWLRDSLAPRYEKEASELLKDPWKARNDYIEVVLDRSRENIERFLAQHRREKLDSAGVTKALKLLELQRFALMMYTSCGWFFDDISGIEATQVIQYAGRALHLGQDLFGNGVEDGFLERLELARSNLPQRVTAKDIYREAARSNRVELIDVGAHYAVNSLFKSYAGQTKIHGYSIDERSYLSLQNGPYRIALGQVCITSGVTLESGLYCFAVLHFGDHNVNCGLHPFKNQKDFDELVSAVQKSFVTADIAATLRILDSHFGTHSYSLKSLFKDEKRKAILQILEETIREVEREYRGIYERQVSLMRFLAELGVPAPKSFRLAAEFVLNTDIRRVLETDPLDSERLRSLLSASRELKVPLETSAFSFALRENLISLSERLKAIPDDLSLLGKVKEAVTLARELPFEVDLWHVQNVYYRIHQRTFPQVAAKRDEDSVAWTRTFLELGQSLSVCAGNHQSH